MTKKSTYQKQKKYEDQVDILNGTSFSVNPNETTGVFLRDTDKLMVQYRNLRLSMYNQYKEYLPDQTTREEMRSYIDEQFIRLVKEYDIHGPVDFPGYIKIKLNYRVRHSYIQGEYRDRERIFVTRNEFDVSNLIDRDPRYDTELDYYEVLEYALSDLVLSELEREVLYQILQELSDLQIERAIRKQYKSRYSATVIRETTKEMQVLLKGRLEDSMLM